MFPTRLLTGIRNRTILNPALYDTMCPTQKSYQGRVEGYDFEKQAENFAKLDAVLRANGSRLAYVAASHSKGDLHTNHRFAVASECGKLMWYKYVAYVAQGGQNHVFVGGLRVRLSLFLNLTADEQTVLLSGNFLTRLCFTPERLKYLDESNTLWS
jgi:hypothetical protein